MVSVLEPHPFTQPNSRMSQSYLDANVGGGTVMLRNRAGSNEEPCAGSRASRKSFSKRVRRRMSLPSLGGHNRADNSDNYSVERTNVFDTPKFTQQSSLTKLLHEQLNAPVVDERESPLEGMIVSPRTSGSKHEALPHDLKVKRKSFSKPVRRNSLPLMGGEFQAEVSAHINNSFSDGLSLGQEEGGGVEWAGLGRKMARRQSTGNLNIPVQNWTGSVNDYDEEKNYGKDQEPKFEGQSMRARREISKIFDESVVFDEKEQRKWAHLPRFSREEIVTGKTLGKGEFGVVNEISEIRVHAARIEVQDEWEGCDEVDFRLDHVGQKSHLPRADTKQFVATRDNGNSSYAMKTIKRKKRSDPARFRASVDLAIEATILSITTHRNIIQLWGLSTAEPGDPGFFLVMDRLCDTLGERINKWKKREKLITRHNKSCQKYQNKQLMLLQRERYNVGSDLADALNYLHRNRIIHRDLKPDNIGFDMRGVVKILDFGLAKELHPKDKVSDDTYRLTGATGSLHYMAPEVFNREAYNERVDVYSISLVIWGILALDKPFSGLNRFMMKAIVFGRGHRPPIRDSWPNSLKEILRFSWSSNPQERPDAWSVASVLQREIVELGKAK